MLACFRACASSICQQQCLTVLRSVGCKALLSTWQAPILYCCVGMRASSQWISRGLHCAWVIFALAVECVVVFRCGRPAGMSCHMKHIKQQQQHCSWQRHWGASSSSCSSMSFQASVRFCLPSKGSDPGIALEHPGAHLAGKTVTAA